ncbi:P63C domain-containing protein [Photorhabdus temperata]|uniref:Bacteriophage Mx8 p63 C-terminal domain-containing protein n=1 Tax=Photorhabdus cinerea TaxID=471575 RepID=A0A7X5TJC2_9GAMM|nr:MULTISPECIES: P63C domain-containing protein [Photorhabdus]MCT8350088.1 P63C domain-containing protein [Photorhabdus temperata]NHB94458.1 hypothetical protein [Photorhabdus cinerea]
MNTKERARKASAMSAIIRGAPKATHTGVMAANGVQCAVLPDGKRVISMQGTGGLAETFGVSIGSKMPRWIPNGRPGQLPYVLQAGELDEFIPDDLRRELAEPIVYRTGGGAAYGVDVTLLPAICEVWIEADKAGVLKQRNHINTAIKANALYKALARVGAIALVDEATGYQRDRERDALAKILEAFVAKELKPWVSTFPVDYYEGLFRIYGLDYPPAGKKNWRPSFIGTVTNNVVYSRLAPDLLPELKKAASQSERKAKLHQWLTDDIGHPKLREHLASIVTLLKISKTPEQFYDLVDTVHPKLILETEQDDGMNKE